MAAEEWEKIADFVIYAKNHIIFAPLPTTTKGQLIAKLDEIVADLEEATNLELHW